MPFPQSGKGLSDAAVPARGSKALPSNSTKGRLMDDTEEYFSATAQDVADCISAVEDAYQDAREHWGDDTLQIALAVMNGEISGPYDTIN